MFSASKNIDVNHCYLTEKPICGSVLIEKLMPQTLCTQYFQKKTIKNFQKDLAAKQSLLSLHPAFKKSSSLQGSQNTKGIKSSKK